MSEQHTPEPWHQNRASKSLHALITDSEYEYVIAELMQFGEDDPRAANARRIVACVNACAGLDTELLENWIESEVLIAQRFGIVSARRQG